MEFLDEFARYAAALPDDDIVAGDSRRLLTAIVHTLGNGGKIPSAPEPDTAQAPPPVETGLAAPAPAAAEAPEVEIARLRDQVQHLQVQLADTQRTEVGPVETDTPATPPPVPPESAA